MMSLIFLGLQGFFNALVYGFTDAVRERVFSCWIKDEESGYEERSYSNWSRNASDISDIDAILEHASIRSDSINA